MVQAPPSLLWAASRRTASAAAGSSSSSNTSQDDSPKPSELKHKPKARVPSFTSSPLTQRPLSPSAMSDSGSESSTSTVAIDIARPKLSSVASRNHGKHRSISAISYGETFASSPSSEDEEGAESYDAFQSANTTGSRHPNDQEMHRIRRRSSTSHSHPSSSVHRSSVSPSTSPGIIRSHRRRSSGNFGLSPSHAGATSPTPPGSPSLFSSSFVGSYEASLLSGRMANKPSNAAALPFTAQLGVLGLGKNTPRGLKCPEHISLPFGAYFWDMDNQEKQGKGSPYVGTLELEEHYMAEYEKVAGQALSEGQRAPKFPGYRIPPKGQIQLVVKNANQTAVKLFLVPYDLSDMPPGSKTFLRQKSYEVPAASSSPSPSPSGTPSPRPKETLRYAVHLQFCAPPAKEKERGRKKSTSMAGKAMRQSCAHCSSGSVERLERPRKSRADSNTASHIYLHKNIRIVFTPRALDLSEKLKVVVEGPAGLVSDSSGTSTPATSSSMSDIREKYSSYAGPGEGWEEAKRRKQELDRAFDRRMQLEDPYPLDPDAASLSVGSLLHSSATLLARTEQMPLLNTLPAIAPPYASNVVELQDAAVVPEPLTFQRSPTPVTVPLPSMVESGLSISRPGSRAELRRQHSPPSPEKRSFRSFMPNEALR